MKKLIILLLLATSVTAQIRYAENEHTSLGIFIDGGSLDRKDVIGYKTFDGGVDFMYVNSVISIHVSSEWFPALHNYKDLMAAFGPTWQIGERAKWEIFLGGRFGAVRRDSDIDELPRTRWNVGVETQITYWWTRDFGTFVGSNLTERNDQELRGYEVKAEFSARFGVRINISKNK